MDIGKALTFYTKDEKFVSILVTFSLLIVSCVFILPIFFVGPLMVGYTVELVKKFQNGDYSLPAIEYGDFWRKGIMLVLVQIALGFIFGLLQMAISIPLSLLGVAGSSVTSRTSSSIASDLVSLAYTGTSLVNMLVSVVFSFFQSIIGIAMIAIYAKTDNVNSLFKLDNYKKLWANNGVNMIIIPIVAGVVGGILVLVGILALCIGILPAIVVSNLINAGLVGQIDTKEIA